MRLRVFTAGLMALVLVPTISTAQTAQLNVANTWTAIQTFASGVRVPNSQAITWVDGSGGLPTLILQSDNNLVLYGTNAVGSLYPVFSQYQHANAAPFKFLVPVQLLASGSTGDASAMSVTAAGTTQALPLSDAASRGLVLTPQVFGAFCDSNGTPGNGHDDTSAIQAALNAAQAIGGTLKFPGNTNRR